MVPVNKTINTQKRFVEKAVLNNPRLKKILFSKLFNHEKWYLGAGCINQTVWNYITKRNINYGIGDFDLVYFDEDISKEAEQDNQKRIDDLFADLKIKVEVVNQARVHTWYKSDFGVNIQQFMSVEEGINSWPTTATAIGVKPFGKGLEIYAPYGLNDLLSLKLRKNSSTTIPENFIKLKIDKWVSKWPELLVID